MSDQESDGSRTIVQTTEPSVDTTTFHQPPSPPPLLLQQRFEPAPLQLPCYKSKKTKRSNCRYLFSRVFSRKKATRRAAFVTATAWPAFHPPPLPPPPVPGPPPFLHYHHHHHYHPSPAFPPPPPYFSLSPQQPIMYNLAVCCISAPTPFIATTEPISDHLLSPTSKMPHPPRNIYKMASYFC